MASDEYEIDDLQQRKQLVGGGSLIDVMHVDYHMKNGMVGFVDLPVGKATKEAIDVAIKSKIQAVNDILTLGK
ncbi:MAG: hypothetical protein ABSB40_12845 [Nitrososphaeria archaeon]|jgi:hypothetical protein